MFNPNRKKKFCQLQENEFQLKRAKQTNKQNRSRRHHGKPAKQINRLLNTSRKCFLIGVRWYHTQQNVSIRVPLFYKVGT